MACRQYPGLHNPRKNSDEKNDTMKAQGFYHSAAWRRVRRMALQRDHFLCQDCLKHGRFKKATEVHHVLELEEHPELALELSNLRSLCWDCHEQTKDHRRGARNLPAGVRIIRIADDGDAGDAARRGIGQRRDAGEVSGAERERIEGGETPPVGR